MDELSSQPSSKAFAGQRKLIAKRWWRRRTIRTFTEEQLARARRPRPGQGEKIRQKYYAKTEEERQQIRQRLSASSIKYWAKASRVHRRRPRKNRDTQKFAELAKVKWDAMSEEEYEARTTSISEGMKRKWAQRTQAQKDVISARRSWTRAKNKLKQFNDTSSIEQEAIARKKLSSAERTLIHSRSPLELKMTQFKSLLQNPKGEDDAYQIFWDSLTPLQKKRAMRIMLNAYEKGTHATYKTL